MTPDRTVEGPRTAWYHSLSNRLTLLLLAVVAVLAIATGVLLWRGLATTAGLTPDTDLIGAAAVAGQEQETVTAILRSTLVNLAVVVAVTLLAAAAFSRALLVDPIARLTQASRSLAAGDLSTRVDLVDRSELGELARAFDAMAESLARSKEDLEARVSARTTELRSLLALSNTIALTTDLRPQIDAVLDQLVAGGRVAAAEILELEPTGKLVRLARREAGQGEPLGGASGDSRANSVDATIAGIAPHAVVDGDELALPLRARDRVVGVLAASAPIGAGWDEERLRWVGGLAAQAAVALENNRLYELARDEAAEDERRHLARELHDSVSQAIYSIVLTAHAAEKRLGTDPAAVKEALAGVIELSEAALAEMRALIFELRPEALAEVGLVGALHRQLDGIELRHGLRAVRRLGQEPELPFTTKQVLLRVAQEALHNVVKHASASTVTVRAAVEAEAGSPGAPATEAEAPAGPTLRLEVVDDGVGFDTSLAYPGHLGLTSMQERVAALGGTLSIESGQGAGTSVTVIVPVSPPTGSEP